jgi:hypothetical protein
MDTDRNKKNPEGFDLKYYSLRRVKSGKMHVKNFYFKVFSKLSSYLKLRIKKVVTEPDLSRFVDLS